MTRSVRTRTGGAVGQVAPLVDRARGQRGARSAASSSAKRSAARSAISGSAPRSKRIDASLRRPSRPDVRAMLIGSHHAISSSTDVVVSEISVEAPPITPAMPIGVVVAVGDDAVAGVRTPVDVVERASVSPSRAQRTRSAPAGHLVEVVGVVGLAQLEHHVVGHVDDRVDRAACRRCVRRLASHAGEAPTVTPCEHAGQEAPAQVRVDDLDRRHGRGAGAPLSATVGVRVGERHAEAGGEVAGHAGDRHGVGPVGVDLEVVERRRRSMPSAVAQVGAGRRPTGRGS